MARIILALLFSSWQVFALSEAPQSFTLDGRLYNSSAGSNPLLDNSVNLRIQILDINKTCILYEEVQVINTASSNGYFNINVGSATTDGKRSSVDTGNSMAGVYQNLASINGRLVINGQNCNITPQPGDTRYLRVSVLPSTTNVQVTLAPDMKLNSVPSAVVAETLNGITTGNILQADSTTQLNQSSLSSVFSNTNYPKLTSLLAGGGNYVSSTPSSGASLPSFSTSTPPASPLAGSVWFDSTSGTVKYFNGSTTQALSTASGALSGDVTGTLGATTVATVGGSTASNVHAAELLANSATPNNTNSMIVRRDSSGGFSASSVSTSSIVARDGASNSVTLQAPSAVSASYTLTWPTAAPVSNGQVLTSTTAGVLSWTTPYGDTNARAAISATAPLSYNSGTGVLALGTLPVANGGTNSTAALNNNRLMTSTGGAIVEAAPLLNGQVFVGSTGAAPVAASLTAGTGVAITNGAGSITISSTGSTGAASGDLSGNYPAPRVAGIQSTPVSSSTPTSAGQVLRYDGSTQYSPAFLGIADLRSSLAGNAQMFPTNCTSSQTLTYSAVSDTFSCATISVGASNFGSQAQNAILAGPSTGGAGAPTFRALASSDLPAGGYDTTYFKNGGNAFGSNASVGTTDATSFSLKANNVVGLTVLPSGKVGVGTTNPSAALQLKAGTTAAGTAPLKMTSGPLLGTAEDGAVEYDGTNYYLTVGTTRTAIPLSGGSASYSTVGAGAGSASTPTLAFSGDPNTGFYDSGSNDVIGVSAGGTNIFNLSSSGMVSPVTGGASVTSAAGTAAAPTYSFAGDTGTGWFRPLASTLAASTGGVERIRVDASGNVGIGTTAPGFALTVASTSSGTEAITANMPSGVGPQIRLTEQDGTGRTGILYYGSGRAWEAGAGNAAEATYGVANKYYVVDRTSNLTRMVIDSSGQMGIGTTTPGAPLDVKGAIRMSGSTSGYTGFQPAAAAGSTVWTLPANDGTANQTLTTNGSGILSWSTPTGTGLSSLNGLTATSQTFATGTTGTAPAFTSATITHTLNIPLASVASVTAGLLSNADYTNFAGKQSSTLADGKILVGNGSSVATAVTPSGDVTMADTGAFTVAKLQGSAVSATAPTTAGQALRWSGSAWSPGFIAMTDLRSTVTGTNQFSNSCLSNQTLTYNSVGDVMSCTNISLPSSQITGSVTPANGGTGQTTYAVGDVLYASSTTALSRLPAGTNGQVLTVASGIPAWSASVSGLPAAAGTAAAPGYAFVGNTNTGMFDAATNTLGFSTNGAEAMRILPSGDVGIGTTTPGALLDIVQADPSVTGSYALKVQGGYGWNPNAGGSISLISGSGQQTAGTVYIESPDGDMTLKAGANMNISSGKSLDTAIPLSLNISSASGGGANPGGPINITAGNAGGNAKGGVVTVTAGNGGLPNGVGGNIVLNGGAKNGTGTNGNIILANLQGSVGIGTTAPIGKLQVYNGDVNAGWFAFDSVQNSVPPPSNSITFIQQPRPLEMGLFTNAAERITIQAAGNVGINNTNPGAALDVKGAIRMSGSTSGYTGFQPAAAAGSTVWTLPANDGTANQVLTTNGSGVLAWSTPAGTGISSLNGLTSNSQTFANGTSGTAPSFTSATSTHTLNIPLAATASVTAGLLSNTDYTNFAAKQSATLADGKILVGNGSSVATAVTPSGDATMTDTGAFTVAKLQGSAVSATTPSTAGQALRWSGSAWAPGFIAMTDLRSTVTGTNQFANSCLSNQTLTYNSVGDVMSCTNISLPSSQITGSVTPANGGTGQTTYAVGDVLYASSTTALSRLPAGTNGQVLTLASGLPSWASASGGLPAAAGTATAPGYAFVGNTNTGMFDAATNTLGLSTNGVEAMRILPSGKVGIGTTNPSATLDVNGAINIAGLNGISFPSSDSNGAGASIAIGAGALGNQPSSAAYGNTAVGYFTLASGSMTTAAVSNTAIGFEAIQQDTGGSNNTALGYQALQLNQAGNYNTATGAQALIQNAGGSSNTAFGWQAQYGTTSGNNNTSLGYFALSKNSTGSSNVAVGNSVGSQTLQTGSNNILIGTSNSVDTPAAATNNFLNIGNAIFATGMNGTLASPAGNVGIGTTAPAGKLQVYHGDVNAGWFAFDSVQSSAAPPSNSITFIQQPRALEMGLFTNAAERITIQAAGNVGINNTNPGATLDVKGAIRMSGSTSGYTGFQPAAAAGSTVWTLPANDGSANQVLTTNGSGVLAWSTPAGTGISSLNGLTTASQTFAIGTTGTAPAFSSATSTHTLNIPLASAASVTAGLLSNADYTTFNGKMSTALADGKIYVGNSGGVATAVTPSGDATMTDAGAFTVTKLQGSAVSATTPVTAGQALRWSGSAWTPNFIAITDLRSTITGTNQFASSCLSNQTLTYNSVGDVMSCANISLPASQITGSVAAANGGTGQTNYAVGDLLYASSTTALSRLPAGTNGQVLTLASGIPSWSAASGGLPAAAGTAAAPGYAFSGNTNTGMFSPAANTVGLSTNGVEAMRVTASGNVGIGTTAPNYLLDVDATNASPVMAVMNRDSSSSQNPSLAAVNYMGSAASGYPVLNLLNLRGTFVGPTSAIQSGDILGEIYGSGSTGGGQANNVGTNVIFGATQNWSSTAHGSYIALSTTANGAGAVTERFRIDQSGKVGIGTTNPAVQLDVTGDIQSSAAILGKNGSAAAPSFTFTNGGDTGMFLGGTQILGFATAGTEKVRILSSGNVGIGTTTPGQKLDVAGNIRGTNGFFTNSNSGSLFGPNSGSGDYVYIEYDTTPLGRIGTGGSQDLSFETGSTGRMRITSGGNVGIGTTTPRAALEVAGASINGPASSWGAPTTTAVDFSTGNLQFTTATCASNFKLNNLKDGGAYSFAVKSATSGTCSFLAYSDAGTTALTVHMPPDHGATTASKHTLYTFLVMGTDLYVSWVTGL